MGTPNGTAVQDDQRLAEIDSILAALSERDLKSAAGAADKLAAQEGFLTEFSTVCQTQVRPAMEAVLGRLQHDGGGGLIEEHPGGEARFPTPRLTLWMSLQGEIVGTPRPDRHPYLQLDGDVIRREVRVSEGDMWNGGGSHSGRIGAWLLSDTSHDRVMQELLDIVRRSAGS